MFDFIKNFFGGIFSFFGGLFGIKKKSEYFMDLGGSETKESPKIEPAAKKPETVAATSEATAEPAKADSPKSEKSKKAKKEAVASVPANTPASVKVAAASNGKVSASSQPILTFAPNNLMPIPNAGRRTPGPNMNSFREMARQVKTK
jgi:cytoskeletal protein RodZ